jgi:hypothetical protein
VSRAAFAAVESVQEARIDPLSVERQHNARWIAERQECHSESASKVREVRDRLYPEEPEAAIELPELTEPVAPGLPSPLTLVRKVARAVVRQGARLP